MSPLQKEVSAQEGIWKFSPECLSSTKRAPQCANFYNYFLAISEARIQVFSPLGYNDVSLQTWLYLMIE